MINIGKLALHQMKLSNEMRKINLIYRGTDSATDVLSFSEKDAAKTEFKKAEDKNFIGEIIISYDKVKEEAKTRNVSVKNEFFSLLAHGFLHLLGYNHTDDKNRKKMEKIESALLNIIK